MKKDRVRRYFVWLCVAFCVPIVSLPWSAVLVSRVIQLDPLSKPPIQLAKSEGWYPLGLPFKTQSQNGGSQSVFIRPKGIGGWGYESAIILCKPIYRAITETHPHVIKVIDVNGRRYLNLGTLVDSDTQFAHLQFALPSFGCILTLPSAEGLSSVIEVGQEAKK
jgi:hypothetical protein